MKAKISVLLFILLLIPFLHGCGGGNDTDSDNDGVVDAIDVDDDNDGLIEVATLEQLDWMRNDLLGTSLTDFSGNSQSEGCPNTGCNGYELIADLDFDTNGDGIIDSNDTYYDYDGSGQNYGWLPIGKISSSFVANFDGNNHRISNLYINRGLNDPVTNGSYIGLFGFVTGAYYQNGIVIKNLILDGKYMLLLGKYSIGSLVGLAIDHVSIENCITYGEVTGKTFVGGIAGNAITYLSISNSISNSDIHGEIAVGGLIGQVHGNVTVDRTASTGLVEGTVRNTGGLIGETTDNSSIINSSSSSNVKGFDGAGGLIGVIANNVTVSNSISSGKVFGTGQGIGGLIGIGSQNITINNAHSIGDVSAIDYAGGLIGQVIDSFSISNSYSTGSVTGNNDIGGLIGSTNYHQYSASVYDCGASCLISNSFSIGSVHGSEDVGGLIGLSYNTELLNTFSTSPIINGIQNTGGLIGAANIGTSISHSFSVNAIQGTINNGSVAGINDGSTFTSVYFSSDQALDALGDNISTPGLLNPPGTIGASLTSMKIGDGVFSGWDTNIWSFGETNQLPGLIFDGTVYRDGDADGILD